jgi:hypothetical protein
MKPRHKSRTVWINALATIAAPIALAVQMIVPMMDYRMAMFVAVGSGIVLGLANLWLKIDDYRKMGK